MLSKYNEFILESQIYELILEANMVFSNDFMFVMQEILNSECSGRLIAKVIMSYKNVFVDINDNYIDISDNPTMIKFTPDDKVKKEEILYRVASVNSLPATHNIIKDAGIDATNCVQLGPAQLMEKQWMIIEKFYSKSHAKLEFYVLENAADKNERVVVYFQMGGNYLYPINNLSNRSGEVRIGRFINKFLSAIKQNFTAKEIEDFVNQYQTVINFRKNAFNNFKIVEGEEIRKWYNIENYLNDKGQLGSSCMRHKGCVKFFDIYCQNPDVCKLLIFTENDKLLGRALLWKLDDDSHFMDRIYTNKDNHIILFETWAKENKYSTYKNKTGQLKVLVEAKEYDFYPYLDTFQYYASDEGILSNSPNGLSYPILELDSTIGYAHDY